LQSKFNDYDSDGVIIYLNFPEYKKISLNINREVLSFSLADVFAKGKLVFGEKDGLKGTLTIQNAYKTNLSPEFLMLRDMVSAGEGEYRSSSLIQAWLRGCIDGKFKEGYEALEKYKRPVEFVKPIWGEMKGERWKDFDAVTSRLNLPELVDYWERNNLSYEYYRGFVKSESEVFKSKSANCVDITEFTIYCLNKAGYEADVLYVSMSYGPLHAVTQFLDHGKKYIMDNGKLYPKGIIGPFNSLEETSYQRDTRPVHWVR